MPWQTTGQGYSTSSPGNELSLPGEVLVLELPGVAYLAWYGSLCKDELVLKLTYRSSA